jgi:hypothetical protein
MDRLVAKKMRRKKASQHEPRSPDSGRNLCNFSKGPGFQFQQQKGAPAPGHHQLLV